MEQEQDKKKSNPQAPEVKKAISLDVLISRLTALRSLLTSLLLIVVAIVLCVFLYRQSKKEVLVIEPFEVPKTLSEMGYTGQVFVNKLTDELHKIITTARTVKEAIGFNAAWLEGSGDFELPTTGLSLSSVLDIVRELVGSHPIRVTGEVVLLGGDSLNVTLRILGKPEKSVRGKLANLEKDILVHSAEYVFRMTDPYILAAYLYNQGDDPQEAIRVIRNHCLNNQRYAKENDKKWVYNLWGNALYGQENYSEAIVKYENATVMDPKFARAYYNWGNALHQQGHDSLAIEKYRKATEMDSKFARAYYDWGNALHQQSHDSLAIEKYRKAAELDPDMYDAYKKWGDALQALGANEEAKVKYVEAEARKPNMALVAEESKKPLTDVTFISWGVLGQPTLEEQDVLKAADSARTNLLKIDGQANTAGSRGITVQLLSKGC